jgi:hypothetical protein
VTLLGAIVGNIFEAMLVDCFHVIPPDLRATFFLKTLSETGLTEVLNDDVFALNIAEKRVGVRSAVFSITKALRLLEVISAHRAGPGNKTRDKVKVALKAIHMLIKVLQEIKGQHIVRGVPQLHLNRVIRGLHNKFS